MQRKHKQLLVILAVLAVFFGFSFRNYLRMKVLETELQMAYQANSSPTTTPIAQNSSVDLIAERSASASTKKDEKDIQSQIKARAEKQYPDDFVMQKFVYDQQIEAYNFMKKIPTSSIKSIAENKYPDDYNMQRFVYQQQSKAKEEMDKKP